MDERDDPIKSTEAVVRLTDANRKSLNTRGIPVNDTTLYWAHNIGEKQAANLYNHLTKGTPLTKNTLKYISYNLKDGYPKNVNGYINWTTDAFGDL